MQYNTIL